MKAGRYCLDEVEIVSSPALDQGWRSLDPHENGLSCTENTRLWKLFNPIMLTILDNVE